MVNGKDEGLFYSLRVTEDKFAESTDPRLVNYRRYYFMIVAYAYNGDTTNPRRFILGRNNVRAYEAIPHKVEFEKMGTVLAAAYGDGVKVRRVAGQGNGGNALRLTPEAEARALSGVQSPEYVPGAGPINIKVVDPKLVKPYEYRLVINTDTSARDTIGSGSQTTILVKEWELYGRPAGSGAGYQLIYTSWAAISESEWDYGRNTWDFLQNRFIKGTERVIPGHGISVSVRNVLDPGAKFYTLTAANRWLCPDATFPPPSGTSLHYMLQDDKNGLIGAEIEYADPTKPWLTGFNPKATSSPWLDAFTEAPSYPDKCFIASTAPNSPYPSPPGSNAWTLWYDFNKNVYRDGLLGAWGPYGLVTPYDGANPENVGIGFGYCSTIGCGPVPSPGPHPGYRW